MKLDLWGKPESVAEANSGFSRVRATVAFFSCLLLLAFIVVAAVLLIILTDSPPRQIIGITGAIALLPLFLGAGFGILARVLPN